MKAIFYRYRNPGFAALELWVAHPGRGLTQDDVRIVHQSHTPLRTEPAGENCVALYRLRPGDTLELDWTFQARRAAPLLSPPASQSSLSRTERQRYLRASLQISREPDVEAHARALAGCSTDPLQVAHAFFHALIRDYGYTYPVRRRGALAMERSRRGDCGQFAALFSAWCRIAGIPARPVIGTRIETVRGMQPHVWAEFWVEPYGWIPADPSLALLLRNPDDVFGKLPADRFAFSYDVDLPFPAYGPPVRPLPLVALTPWNPTFEGRRLRWGTNTLAGAIPYFQPAYPRIYAGWGPNWLIVPDSMGTWSVDVPPKEPAAAYPLLGAFAVLTSVAGFGLAGMASGPVAWGAALAGEFGIGLALATSAITWRKRKRQQPGI